MTGRDVTGQLTTIVATITVRDDDVSAVKLMVKEAAGRVDSICKMKECVSTSDEVKRFNEAF